MTVITPQHHAWEIAWLELERALLKLPADHLLFGSTIDSFMCMYATGSRVSFKHVMTRNYLHVDLPAEVLA